jgi:hypothetical protein
MQHVIVDNLATDSWSIVAAVAALVAAGVGIGGLIVPGRMEAFSNDRI